MGRAERRRVGGAPLVGLAVLSVLAVAPPRAGAAQEPPSQSFEPPSIERELPEPPPPDDSPPLPGKGVPESSWTPVEPSRAELTLGEDTEARQAGEAPVSVASRSKADAGRRIEVEVLDSDTAARVGADGFLFRVEDLTATERAREAVAEGEEAGGPEPVGISVDYSSASVVYDYVDSGDSLRDQLHDALVGCAAGSGMAALRSVCDAYDRIYEFSLDNDNDVLARYWRRLLAGSIVAGGEASVSEAVFAAADGNSIYGGSDGARTAVQAVAAAAAVGPFMPMGPATVLRPDVIAQGKRITDGLKLQNTAVVRDLTAAGGNLADWGKYTTTHYQTATGVRWQVHYYYNPVTRSVFYGRDFKIVILPSNRNK